MAITVSAQASSSFRFPADSEIHRILSERIEVRKQSVGLVVGLIRPGERRIIAHGHYDIEDPRFVDGNTVFEIGSVTKVFTALLLADMVQRAEVKLDDPIAKHIPKEVVVPHRGDQEITLAELATHMSGLPGMPDNFAPADPNNPYADYSIEQLYQFLSNYQLMRKIGAQWEYSNLGFGLLGQALARCTGRDYETLVFDRILKPLNMKSTAITLSSEMKARLTIGHNPALEAVSNWDLPTLAGAGALRSTANDLLTFLEMSLGIKESPLAPALDATLAVRRPLERSDSKMGLGWLITKIGEDEMIWHNGGTGGYTSFVGFLLKAKAGVVVLSNTSTFSMDDIGQHLLNPEIPLSTLPKSRTVISIDPRLYDGYVGRYRLEPDLILTVTRTGSGLFSYIDLHESKTIDTQITFEIDDKSRAVSLVLYQNGQRMPALRIEE